MGANPPCGFLVATALAAGGPRKIFSSFSFSAGRLSAGLRFLVIRVVRYGYVPSLFPLLFFLVMSKADYESVKTDFLKELDTANTLAKFQAPLDARQKQLSDVGAAAVSYRCAIFLVLWVTGGHYRRGCLPLLRISLKMGRIRSVR